ncbi:MAG: DUF1828 domain-containing protein [Chloroflexi bacterium]|nr:DUF1828 domain-containing protein [Chloroflexota bacterium]
MTINAIEHDFREKVCAQVQLEPAGRSRYRVYTPFHFNDGDHLVVVLRQKNGHWELSDEGHTYMRLTYDLDEKSLYQGTRQQIIANTLDAFSIDDVEGELRAEIRDERYGDVLFDFVQAILRINDVTYLSRERVKSTFMDDFRAFISERVPEHRRNFDWHHPQYDLDGTYPVDCRINGRSRPLFVFALANDNKTQVATIALHQFERWGLEYRSLSIFESQEEISRKVLARFSDVSEKQYSNLYGNRIRIGRFLDEMLGEQG